MTGIFLRVQKGEGTLNAEIEYLTEEEIGAAMANRTPEELIRLIIMLSGAISRIEPPPHELQDWREMFEAFAQLPIPKEHRNRQLWPNQWHKDCAIVALALARRAGEAE